MYTSQPICIVILSIQLSSEEIEEEEEEEENKRGCDSFFKYMYVTERELGETVNGREMSIFLKMPEAKGHSFHSRSSLQRRQARQ